VYAQCRQWNAFALARLDRVRPDVVILTQYPEPGPGGQPYSPARWQQGLVSTIHGLPVPPSHVVVLGNIPQHAGAGPECLSLHPQNVQQCSGPPESYVSARSRAERAATVQTGSRYIDTVPWFCTRVCSDVIGHYQPYWDAGHITGTYAAALVYVLATALDLPSYLPTGATSTSTTTVPTG
jgi:hypothetical protein